MCVYVCIVGGGVRGRRERKKGGKREREEKKEKKNREVHDKTKHITKNIQKNSTCIYASQNAKGKLNQ